MCKVNDDCTGDLICNGGVCTQTCTVSSQADVCGDRFKCVLGVCSKPCVVRGTSLSLTGQDFLFLTGYKICAKQSFHMKQPFLAGSCRACAKYSIMINQ